MGDAQRGDDALAFYAANLGPTRALFASIAPVQLSDNDGALPPRRYLLHIADIDPPNLKIWIKTGPFQKGVLLGVTASIPNFPMSLIGVQALEINVRKGDNDQIAVVMSSGTGTLYITEISRRV